MIAFVFAMIVLQNADPDPVKTPAASLGQRLTGSAPTSALQGLDTSSPFGDTTVTVGCTYGAPRLGPALLSDANDLTRTLTMSNCTDPAGQSFATPLAFAYPTFATVGRSGGFSPGSVSSIGSLAVSTPQRTLTTFTMVPRPERSYAIQHLIVPTEFNGGAGTATTSQFHASATTSRSTVPVAHRPAPVTHQL